MLFMKNIKLLRSFFFFLTGLFITVFTVNAATENITQIAFTTPPHEVDAGVVSPVLTVQTRNATGTVEQLSNTADLTLQSSSGTGELLSSAAGSPVSQITMSSGTANRNFFYRDITPGTHTLSVTVTVRDGGPSWQTVQEVTIISTTTEPDQDESESEEEPPTEEPEESDEEGSADESEEGGGQEVENTTPSEERRGPSGGTSLRARLARGLVPVPTSLLLPSNENESDELGLDEGQVLGESVFLFLHDIGLGSRLEPDVSELQSRLARDGYYAGPQLGYFGRYTEMRLRAYQAENGLTPSGRLDVATRAILNNNDPTVLSQNAFQVLLDLLELEQ